MFEIERKFEVSKPSVALEEHIISRSHIKQGYLTRDNCVVRIRILDTTHFVDNEVFPAAKPTTNFEAWLTIKSPNVGITRKEFEYKIPTEDAYELLNMTTGSTILKTRYKIQDNNNQVWEVDFFHEQYEGLVLAEIELLSDIQRVAIPDWIGEEVSTNPRYFNSNM